MLFWIWLLGLPNPTTDITTLLSLVTSLKHPNVRYRKKHKIQDCQARRDVQYSRCVSQKNGKSDIYHRYLYFWSCLSKRTFQIFTMSFLLSPTVISDINHVSPSGANDITFPSWLWVLSLQICVILLSTSTMSNVDMCN